MARSHPPDDATRSATTPSATTPSATRRATESRGGSPRRAPAPHQRRRDPERTKARILDAAVEEFSAKGFAGARVSEIAERAGVNQQLIAYYFDSKQGLYREIGRRWRAYEAAALPDDLDFAELVRRYVRTSVDPRHGARLLAWEGLADSGETGEDDEEQRERNARLRQEVEAIRRRQRAGEIDDRLDPAVLLLVVMSAANALTVYPQLARGLFGGADGSSPELVERYAAELTKLLAHLGPHPELDRPGQRTRRKKSARRETRPGPQEKPEEAG